MPVSLQFIEACVADTVTCCPDVLSRQMFVVSSNLLNITWIFCLDMGLLPSHLGPKKTFSHDVSIKNVRLSTDDLSMFMGL